MAIVSCLFVVVSTLCLIFSTLPAFQQKQESGKISRKKLNIFSPPIVILNPPSLFTEEAYFFEVAEAVFVGWFSFEYIIRFVAAPQKYQ